MQVYIQTIVIIHLFSVGKYLLNFQLPFLEWVSWKRTLSNDKLYSNRKSNRKYNRNSILVKDRSYLVFGTGTTGKYSTVRAIALIYVPRANLMLLIQVL